MPKDHRHWQLTHSSSLWPKRPVLSPCREMCLPPRPGTRPGMTVRMAAATAVTTDRHSTTTACSGAAWAFLPIWRSGDLLAEPGWHLKSWPPLQAPSDRTPPVTTSCSESYSRSSCHPLRPHFQNLTDTPILTRESKLRPQPYTRPSSSVPSLFPLLSSPLTNSPKSRD